MDDLDTRAKRAADRLRTVGRDRDLSAEQIKDEIKDILTYFSSDEIGELGIVT